MQLLAQSNFCVKGKIIGINKEPLAGAVILIRNLKDSSLVKTALSNNAGVFAFTPLVLSDNETYSLSVILSGYEKTEIHKIQFDSLKIANLGEISLSPVPSSLKEVFLTGNRPLLQTKAGKVILNVSNTILSSGASALEVLSKAPGVMVDNNDNIRLNGRSGIQVMIDGKNSLLQATELANLLNGTPANTIDHIELISSPGANYDADGSGGIIHIKLKKDKNIGTNGSLSFNTGISDLGSRYKANYRSSPGISFNSRNKVANIFGNYSYADQTTAKTSELDRVIDYNQEITLVDVDYFSRQNRINHTYRAGVDYFIDSKTIIGFLLNGAYSDISIKKLNTSEISTPTIESFIKTNAGQNRSIRNTGFNLNLKTSPASTQEFSIDLDYSKYNRSSEEILINTFSSIPMKKMPTTPAMLENYSPGDYILKSVKADYLLPVSRSTKFNGGVKFSRVESENSLDFGEVINSVFIRDNTFTSKFSFDENIFSAYLTLNAEMKNSSIQIGLRAENTSSLAIQRISGHQTQRNYLNLFPNLQYSVNVGRDKLSFSYSRRIERPLYEDLNPFLGYLDQYSYRAGNPYLSPSTSNTLEINHSFRNMFSTTLSTSITDKFSTTVFEQNDSTAIVTQVKRNLDKQYVYGLTFNAPLKLAGGWWDANFTMQALYLKFRSASSSGNLNLGGSDIIFTLLNSFNLGNGFTAELSGKYETPSYYGIARYRSIYYADAGFSKTFANKRGSMRLRLADLFNTTSARFRSDYQNLNLYDKEKPESRIAMLNLTWNLGKSTVSAARRRSTSAEPEQRRLSQ